ncbi:tetratricopeptide repeat protein [Roseimicrobium gellanilyticum]|uniref:Regulator of microtubule dynamics protein 1 n=2 Tax=Roseimicrobium gellanilyticum TaxID=748857 RepID=A0A366HHH9_9BACT|nr:tetratricopeptide repeat protein [Roseimicrobium gellanilyticum]
MFCPKPLRLRASAKALLSAAALCIASVSVQAQSPEELLQKADALDVKLEAKEALQIYLELEKLQPDNADVLVRIARQYRHLMADASSNDQKLKLGNIALQYGKRAAAADPKNSDAQLSCAISYGKMVPFMSNKEQVACSKAIKAGAEKAVKLNSSNDLAWHILGRWHRNVANVGGVKKMLASMIYDKLPEASNDEAVNCLEKAVKLNPGRLMHYVELGRVYAQVGRTSEACKYLEKGIAMPSVEKDDADAKAAAKELLASLK